MSKTALERIEKTLDKLVRQQGEISKRLARLERAGGAGANETPDCEEVVTFLDGFRAGEALGESSLGAWIAVCESDTLRGGLRTVQLREGSHARLLEERIKELGGSPKAEIPEAIHASVMEGSATREKTDAEKLSEFVARFPDIDAALKPIYTMADRLDSDPETQSLLRTIAQDERATLEFIADACRQLNQG
jgi:hypothetical protein